MLSERAFFDMCAQLSGSPGWEDQLLGTLAAQGPSTEAFSWVERAPSERLVFSWSVIFPRSADQLSSQTTHTEHVRHMVWFARWTHAAHVRAVVEVPAQWQRWLMEEIEHAIRAHIQSGASAHLLPRTVRAAIKHPARRTTATRLLALIRQHLPTTPECALNEEPWRVLDLTTAQQRGLATYHLTRAAEHALNADVEHLRWSTMRDAHMDLTLAHTLFACAQHDEPAPASTMMFLMEEYHDALSARLIQTLLKHP